MSGFSLATQLIGHLAASGQLQAGRRSVVDCGVLAVAELTPSGNHSRVLGHDLRGTSNTRRLPNRYISSRTRPDPKMPCGNLVTPELQASRTLISGATETSPKGLL
jgi:hypothetical protein